MRRKNYFLLAISLLVFLFLTIPLVIITVTAFGEDSTIVFPITGFTFSWFLKVFNSSSFINAFILSLKLALIASFLALIVGLLASYGLSRYNFKFKNAIKSFFLSPTIVPAIVLGFALFQLLVLTLNLSIYTSLIIGHFLVVLPYIIRIITASLDTVDISLEEVAWSLGMKKGKTFLKIILPNISSGIFAALLLAFINSFNNIPISMFLSGPRTSTLPATLMNYIEYFYDPSVSAISVILMVLTISIMFIVEKTLGLGTLLE